MTDRGQVIGLAGSTGLSTGPHLHWAAKINQARVDPLALLEIEF
jgi:murein DD-endopeptidase MepM/ murein hydrolase activator NlpD